MGTYSTDFDDSNFNLYNCTPSQNMYKKIFEEFMKKYGVSCKYLPATLPTGGRDDVFGENRRVTFESATTIKVFFEDYEKYGGEGDMFEKFGFSFEDEMTVWIDKVIGDSSITGGPKEGDLIYFSMMDALFEINFVEQEQPFYMSGILLAYKLKLKKYRQSAEDTFGETGINDSDIQSIVEDLPSGINADVETEADESSEDDSDEENSPFGLW